MKKVLKKTATLASKAAESYKKPTPHVWRKIGDSLMLIGSTITGISAFTMPPIVTAIAAGCTCLGKIITNFAS